MSDDSEVSECFDSSESEMESEDSGEELLTFFHYVCTNSVLS